VIGFKDLWAADNVNQHALSAAGQDVEAVVKAAKDLIAISYTQDNATPCTADWFVAGQSWGRAYDRLKAAVANVII